jgi:hypothetical protein
LLAFALQLNAAGDSVETGEARLQMMGRSLYECVEVLTMIAEHADATS